MNQSAHVASLSAIRDFRAALITFCEDARDAMATLEIEVRRGQQFIAEEQLEFWRRQIHVGGDLVQQAKSDLDRARTMPVPGGHASCREERMAVERAQSRVLVASEKEEITRRWGRKVDHEVAEYNGRATQLATVLEGKMPLAIAFLDRVLDNLENYLAADTSSSSAPLASRSAALPRAETNDKAMTGVPAAPAHERPEHGLELPSAAERRAEEPGP